jgi:hypothetical protein
MSASTHVSDSLKSASEATSKSDAADTQAASNTQDEKDCKSQYIVQYCVEALLNDKKRKLAQLVGEEVGRAVEENVPAVNCGCGCLLVPCAKRVALREKYSKKVAQKNWPSLEKEFIRDVADTLWQSKRTHEWLSKQLAASTHENGVLRLKLGIVASVF